jgi:hypothetical protein
MQSGATGPQLLQRLFVAKPLQTLIKQHHIVTISEALPQQGQQIATPGRKCKQVQHQQCTI